MIYSVDRHDQVKWTKARTLLRQLRSGPGPMVLLWQVLGESVRYLRAWQDQGRLSRRDLERYVNTFRRLFPVAMPTPRVLDHALDLSSRFSLSH